MSQELPSAGEPISGMAPAVVAEDIDWYDQEPGLGEAVHEVQRVLRRARSRPIATLLLVAFAVALVVGMVARKGKLHRARVILRLQEQALASDSSLMGRGDLQNHIWHVVFSGDRLLTIMERQGLFESERELGDDIAISEMRDALDVDVFRNYFLLGRGGDGGPEERLSVRIAISFTHHDHSKVTAVAQDLAAEVIAVEAERRRVTVAAAVEVSKQAVSVAKARVEQREQELTSKSYLLSQATGVAHAQLQVEVDNLTDSLRAYQAMLDAATGQAEEVELAAGAEANRLGLDIQIAEVRSPPPLPKSKTKLLVAIGIIGFIFCLPLCAIAVGAFDTRVYDIEDVERIGMAGLGHVPRFSGANDGSLSQRIGGRPWWRR